MQDPAPIELVYMVTSAVQDYNHLLTYFACVYYK